MMPDVPVPGTHEVLVDKDVTVWREKMIAERRAQAAEARCEELAELLKSAEEANERLTSRLREALGGGAEEDEPARGKTLSECSERIDVSGAVPDGDGS